LSWSGTSDKLSLYRPPIQKNEAGRTDDEVIDATPWK
jgi:hypothetical protein